MTPAAESALQAKGLCVALGARQVISGLDLHLPRGHWTCVVGPNGAGKSTLLKALAGLLPSEGDLVLHGQSLRLMDRRMRARALSWLGQEQAIASDLRVYDTVMLGRLAHQNWFASATAQDEAAVNSALEALHIAQLRDRLLIHLSAGERQRVLLARAFCTGAPVMLLDEPLSNLDPPHQADCLDWIRSACVRGVSVVTVLHEISMALQADTVLVLDHGRLVHLGLTSDVSTREAIENVFEHRLHIAEVQGQWVALPRVGTPRVSDPR